MNKNRLRKILEEIQEEKISVDQAMESLKDLPFEDLDFAKVDHHRSIRNGFPEVIYGEGKSLEHLCGIVEAMDKRGNENILVTRLSEDGYRALRAENFDVVYHPLARIAIVNPKELKEKKGKVIVATGGTSDIAVAEEAAVTIETFGTAVDRLYDVGVAGIHRLLSQRARLSEGDVIIAVAGMEGALASVIGGLAEVPVIAVPTSVGYGASFGGVAALLSMLNSCASGVGVVNIDNGFGAGYLACMIINGRGNQ